MFAPPIHSLKEWMFRDTIEMPRLGFCSPREWNSWSSACLLLVQQRCPQGNASYDPGSCHGTTRRPWSMDSYGNRCYYTTSSFTLPCFWGYRAEAAWLHRGISERTSACAWLPSSIAWFQCPPHSRYHSWNCLCRVTAGQNRAKMSNWWPSRAAGWIAIFEAIHQSHPFLHYLCLLIYYSYHLTLN